MSKQVLVTGGAGFIAHQVIATILKQTDWRVVTIDRLDFSGNLNRIHEVVQELDASQRRRLRVVFHDMKSEFNDQIRNSIGECRIILHLGAASHVARSIVDPLSFVMDNTVGTCNVLNFARQQADLERFVYFSTDEVFGPAPWGVDYDERARYNSTNPYSASKAGGEELCVAFHNTYGTPVYICHTANVYGRRQHPEKYIPLCIRKILKDELLSIHADPVTGQPSSRHYVHVQDVADALLFLLNLDETRLRPEARTQGSAKCPKFNIISNTEFDNLELAQKVAKVLHRPLRYELADFHQARPGLDLRYSLSGDLMKSLGWQPSQSFDRRLKDLVEWTQANPQWL